MRGGECSVARAACAGFGAGSEEGARGYEGYFELVLLVWGWVVMLGLGWRMGAFGTEGDMH